MLIFVVVLWTNTSEELLAFRRFQRSSADVLRISAGEDKRGGGEKAACEAQTHGCT